MCDAEKGEQEESFFTIVNDGLLNVKQEFNRKLAAAANICKPRTTCEG